MKPAYQPLFDALEELRRALDAASLAQAGAAATTGRRKPKSTAVQRATNRVLAARDRARESVDSERGQDTFAADLLKASTAPWPKLSPAPPARRTRTTRKAPPRS